MRLIRYLYLVSGERGVVHLSLSPADIKALTESVSQPIQNRTFYEDFPQIRVVVTMADEADSIDAATAAMEVGHEQQAQIMADPV